MVDRQGELRALRYLLPLGSVVVALVAAWETYNGVLAVWDRWLYPALFTVFSLCSLTLWRWPQHHAWVRAASVLSVNLYLSAVLLMTLFIGNGADNLYALVTTLVWLPFGYGLMFVMLPSRIAVPLSLVAAGLTFAPIFMVMAMGKRPDWDAEFTQVMPMLALSQVVYIVLLMAISDLRAGFHRTRERLEVVQELALTDALTGVANRRALQDQLLRGLAQAERSGQPMAVILMDVDHFKQINDTHGHNRGDDVLVALAQLLRDQLRTGDLLGRWGGEEFMVLAPHTPMHAGTELAERIRRALADFEFPHGQPVTLSLGVTQTLPGDNTDSLVQRADRALYRAKANGRNRVESAALVSI